MYVVCFLETLTSIQTCENCEQNYIVTWYPTETMEVGWLLFELTVTWLGWHLVALTKSPDQGGEEGRSQMIGWGPKTEVAPFSPSAKKTRRNVSYWKGLVADRPIAIYSGRRRQKHILDTRDPRFFKPV